MVEKEKLKHYEAFEYYYALGDNRNLEKVAEKFGIALRTAQKWSSDFGWQDRIILRDKANSERLAKATDDAIVNEKSKIINIVKASLKVYVDTLKRRQVLYDGDGQPVELPKIQINSTSDLERLVKLYLLLIGEHAEEQVNVRIIDAGETDGQDSGSDQGIPVDTENQSQD